MTKEDGRRRAVIEDVRPQIDCGRFPIKRTVGEQVTVSAACFADGHDRLRCVLRFRRQQESSWREVEMEPLPDDHWEAAFTVEELGGYVYSVAAWVDPFRSWRDALRKKVEAGQDVSGELQAGAELVREAAGRAATSDRRLLERFAKRLGGERDPQLGLSEELAVLVDAYPDRSRETVHQRELPVTVDRERARFSTWYELFPRSLGEPGEHGTLADVVDHLGRVARMGFDVLYLPPIHPIGRTHRKGRNNSPVCEPGDPGSPWAIGSDEGGHKAVHPDLGGVDDLERLVEAARSHGLEIAMDIAFQCSPDHPWVSEHPEWFRRRPDGSIQYAENPPKRYEDIYPLDFETEDWEGLWEELRSVIAFWVDRGVRIFRVDNPHTKAFGFWEWAIGTLKEDHPELVFLSESFTRPRVMHRLAKLGFDQSYTYFTWRNTKHELTTYFTELTSTGTAEYFRPNLWPNTPDILPEPLQYGGRPAFIARLVLAATLGASYGIYGPAFELCVDEPVAPGREEYLYSEKYEIKDWKLDDPESLAELIARVNAIRHGNPALQTDRTLRFLETENEQLIAYAKTSPDGENVVVTVVNLDPHHVHSGWLTLPLEDLGVDPTRSFQLHDLLTEARYHWHGPTNYIELDPDSIPAHVFRVRRRIATERDFDYFM